MDDSIPIALICMGKWISTKRAIKMTSPTDVLMLMDVLIPN